MDTLLKCQNDQYLTALYGIVTSVTAIATGVMFLYEQADIKLLYDRDMKDKIEEYNQEEPPTSISEADPQVDPDLDWKKMHLL